MENVIKIFDEIEDLLDKNTVMIRVQDGSSRLYFKRTLEVDITELKNKLLESQVDPSH